MKNILKGKWVFDTNLLVYVLDKKSPYFGRACDLFSLLNKDQIQPVVSTQNITETVNVFIKIYKQPVNKVTRAIKELLSGFNFDLISPLPSTIPIFLKFLKATSYLKDVYDIFLAATLIDNKIPNLLTTNEKDFRGIKKLKIVNPLKGDFLQESLG